ncbi:MAG TPA: amino acid adenylation domain-containing protein, partial [Longimicrobiaceae bacterium]
LARWSGQDDVSVGMPIAGRNRTEVEGLIGFFVNTLVVRTRFEGGPDGRELLRRVRETTLGAFQHQDVPFEKLVEELGVERSLSHTPLFQASFGVRNVENGGTRLAGTEVEPIGGGGAAAKFDLGFTLTDAGEELPGSLTYRAELFDAATMDRLLEHFALLLRGMAERPDTPVAELPLLAEWERRRVLEEWGGPRMEVPAGLCVHHLVEAEARRAPGAPAVVAEDGRLGYAELDARANRLASHLRGLGVGPEVRVGVCLDRGAELVVALLAVLKAGGAYVPLDPVYPAERQTYMLADSEARVLVTHARLEEGLAVPGVRVVRVDADRERIAAEPAEAPESGVGPENLSHVIYTSGSTGRPKGVMIRHRSAVVMLRWLREQLREEDRASVLASTSVSFDVSVAEIFGALSWGGKLVVVGNALDLARLPEGEEVRVVSMVPSAAAELLRMGAIPAGVRVMNLGGEALPSDLAQGLYALGTVESVGNLYGPSEDTTYTTYAVVERGSGEVLIGRPVAETRIYLLDPGLQPVPIGVVGELWIAGEGLARGYQARPDMTAERFLPDPYAAEPGGRMYRTGDRVRWRADGSLDYLGRFDHQVKVRGFRIEPGEIEVALRAHPGVREAVVVVREDVPGDRRLVAYLAPPEGAEAPAAAELRTHLRAGLPEHMVPSAFVALERLPLTPNGKVDRMALPAPDAAGTDEAAYVAPRTPTEEAVARVWQEVLGVGRVGVNDNFFDLGGHSLLLVQLHSRLKETLAPGLSLADLFGFRTLADLAKHVDAAREAGEPDTQATLDRADARRSRMARQRAARAGRPTRAEEDDGEEDE